MGPRTFYLIQRLMAGFDAGYTVDYRRGSICVISSGGNEVASGMETLGEIVAAIDTHRLAKLEATYD